MTGTTKRTAVALLTTAAIALAATGCTDSTSSSGTSTTGAGASSTTVAGASTTVVTTTIVTTTTGATTTIATTVPATTVAPPPPTTAGGGSACTGASGIPGGADVGTVLHGDIDGDLANDTVTEYSLGGVPHVHAQLASGGQSDAVVQIGFADHVAIKFTDFDHSLGASTPPPVAVLAIGAAQAGTAYFAILTLTTHYCIRPWSLGGSMFTGHISQQGPFEGMWCDGAAGHIYYSLTTVEDAGGGNWNVTTRLMHHNFTTLTLDAPQTSTVTLSEADMKDTYANLNPC